MRLTRHTQGTENKTHSILSLPDAGGCDTGVSEMPRTNPVVGNAQRASLRTLTSAASEAMALVHPQALSAPSQSRNALSSERKVDNNKASTVPNRSNAWQLSAKTGMSFVDAVKRTQTHQYASVRHSMCRKAYSRLMTGGRYQMSCKTHHIFLNYQRPGQAQPIRHHIVRSLLKRAGKMWQNVRQSKPLSK